MVTIRPYQPRDADDLYDICLRTGAAGSDATEQFDDPRLLGAVYVGPYLAFAPELAFVLDDGGRACGYVLAARDTAAFERTCERDWWPALRARHPVAREPPQSRTGSADADLVALLHAPHVADPTLLRAYPSHLHIDLLPHCQHSGFGRRLIERELSTLAAAGSPGVHLVVSASNDRAIGFYRRLGFVEPARHAGGAAAETTAGGRTFGLRLAAPTQ